MNAQDRQAIDQVFVRLQEVERQAGPRDSEAEAYIQERLRAQPGSAYYLAQTVVVQQQALENAQRRIQELEQQAARAAAAPAATPEPVAASGFGRFGFGRSAGRQPPAAEPAPVAQQQPGGFGRSAGGGGGFLAGAAQTALGVAGGMMLGSLLGNLFGGGSSAHAAPAPAPEPAAPEAVDAGADPDAGGWDDVGADDMDMGEF